MVVLRNASFFSHILKIVKNRDISFVLSVRPSVHPSVCVEKLGSDKTDFYEI